MKYNSNVNQTIKRKFVENEVITCQSQVTDYILSLNDYENAPFTWDDVENLYIDNSEEIEEKQEKLELIENQMEDVEDSEHMEILESKQEELENEIEELEAEQENVQEVYEWWEVSSYLLSKLKERGEVVIPHMNLWGRCTTGQTILLDGIISNICKDMKILEGQENSWEGFAK